MMMRFFTAVTVLAAVGAQAIQVTTPDHSALARRSQPNRLSTTDADIAAAKRDLVEANEYENSTLAERGFYTKGKVGLAWQNPASWDKHIKDFKSSKAGIIYTWSPWCPGDWKGAGYQCCPMLNSGSSSNVNTFNKQKYKGSKCLMGMNEVNVPSQNKMSASKGAKIWNSHLRDMHHQGYTLISPSVTSGEDGIKWLHDFFNSCGGKAKKCQVDIVAAHYYGTSVSDFKKWITRFHNEFGLPVMVTEFACQDFSNRHTCSSDQVKSFLQGTTSWMYSQDWIKGYNFFGPLKDMSNVNPKNRLIDSGSGKPNSLGRSYLAGH